MNDNMKIVHASEDQNILLKSVTKTVKNEINNQKGDFLGMLIGTLGAFLLGNFLSRLVNKGSGIVRAGEGIKKKIINATAFFN